MKFILFALMATSFNSALAANLICEQQLTAERIESTYVGSGKYNLGITKISKECASSYCRDTKIDFILSPMSLCGVTVDLKNCKTSESATAFDISCDNGAFLTFELDKNSVGQIMCGDGVQIEFLEVGVCRLN